MLVEYVGSMLKVNDGGEQERPEPRPFVVVACSRRSVSSVISIGKRIGVGSKGLCKVRKGKQVQGGEIA